jgi:hypothetical protein
VTGFVEEPPMRSNYFLEVMYSQLQELTNYFWPEDSVPRLEDRIQRLERTAQRRYAVLVRLRTRIEGLRHRLSQMEKRALLLPRRVKSALRQAQSPTAWRDALELDRIRHDVRQDRAALRRYERSYDERLASLKRLRHRLADLNATLTSRRAEQSAGYFP